MDTLLALSVFSKVASGLLEHLTVPLRQPIHGGGSEDEAEGTSTTLPGLLRDPENMQDIPRVVPTAEPHLQNFPGYYETKWCARSIEWRRTH